MSARAAPKNANASPMGAKAASMNTEAAAMSSEVSAINGNVAAMSAKAAYHSRPTCSQCARTARRRTEGSLRQWRTSFVVERNNNVIKTLIDMRNMSYDKLMSLKGNPEKMFKDPPIFP